jgi:hypothetical protein
MARLFRDFYQPEHFVYHDAALALIYRGRARLDA